MAREPAHPELEKRMAAHLALPPGTEHPFDAEAEAMAAAGKPSPLSPEQAADLRSGFTLGRYNAHDPLLDLLKEQREDATALLAQKG